MEMPPATILDVFKINASISLGVTVKLPAEGLQNVVNNLMCKVRPEIFVNLVQDRGVLKFFQEMFHGNLGNYGGIYYGIPTAITGTPIVSRLMPERLLPMPEPG